jgi:branched-chain amino acid transport system substrate-binding protein
VLAACGSDDNGASGDTTAKPADTTAKPADTTAKPADTTAPGTTAAPSGGANAIPKESGPADSSKDPVVIGWMNNDEGLPSFPADTAGAQAVVKYINESLGGIGGRPVELDVCGVKVGDQASISGCAQKLVNNDKVNIVSTGFVIGSDPLYPVFDAAGMPISIQVPLGAADLAAKTGFSHFPGNPGISAGLPAFLVDYKDAKSIAIVVSDNDAGKGAIELVKQVPTLKKNNVEIKPVFVKDDETDYTVPIKAAGADTADAFLPLVAQSGCIQVAKALDQLGLKDKPVATTGLCADPSVTKEVAGGTDGWYIGFAGTPAFVGPGVDPEVDFYLEKYPTVGDPKDQFGAGASQSWGQLLALWEIGNKIGADKLSKETWLEGIKGFTGPVLLGAREVACPGPVFPSVCTSQSRVWQQSEGGAKWTDATDGKYIDPFAG